MKMEEIEKLVKLLQKSTLNQIYWSEGDSKLVLKKSVSGGPVQASIAPQPAASAAPAPVAPAATPAPEKTEEAPSDNGWVDVPSPMVGTFYSASSPDAKPYVKVGDTVTVGQVLCIVEAMKLMNEIESEVSGVVKEVCVNNESPVEFGTVLFKIAPG